MGLPPSSGMERPPAFSPGPWWKLGTIPPNSAAYLPTWSSGFTFDSCACPPTVQSRETFQFRSTNFPTGLLRVRTWGNKSEQKWMLNIALKEGSDKQGNSFLSQCVNSGCSGRQKRRTWPVNRVSNTLRVISKEAGAKGCRGAQGEWQSRQRAVFKAWFGPLHSLWMPGGTFFLSPSSSSCSETPQDLPGLEEECLELAWVH